MDTFGARSVAKHSAIGGSSTDEERLQQALLFLWNLRQRGNPQFVVINYTDRRTARGILGRKLCERMGI